MYPLLRWKREVAGTPTSHVFLSLLSFVLTCSCKDSSSWLMLGALASLCTSSGGLRWRVCQSLMLVKLWNNLLWLTSVSGIILQLTGQYVAIVHMSHYTMLSYSITNNSVVLSVYAMNVLWPKEVIEFKGPVMQHVLENHINNGVCWNSVLRKWPFEETIAFSQGHTHTYASIYRWDFIKGGRTSLL